MSAFGGIADIVLAGPGGDQKNRNAFEPDRGAARLLLIAYTDKFKSNSHGLVPIYVRFRGQSGHAFLHRTCLLLTQSGHGTRLGPLVT